jgi:hypothetical protein
MRLNARLVLSRIISNFNKKSFAVLQFCSQEPSEFDVGCSLLDIIFTQKNTEQGTLNIKHRIRSILTAYHPDSRKQNTEPGVLDI